MKKILRRLFLIIIVSLIFCFTKQNNVYGIGLVYQAWAEDGGLYFRTFTAPLPATVKSYINDYVKIGPKLRTSNNDSGTFTYKYTENGKTKTLSGPSMWAMGSSNSYFKVDSPSTSSFATRKIVFHKKPTVKKSSDSGTTIHYSNLSSGAITGTLNDVYGIYNNIQAATKKVTRNNNIEEITRASIFGSGSPLDSEKTLYRMTLLAPNSSDNAIYVADRKLTSNQVSNIKGENDSNLGTKDGHARAIYVSQFVGFSNVSGGSNWTIVNNPIDALNHTDDVNHKNEGEFQWGDGTLGISGAKSLGSVANLYDNILVFPVDSSRKIIVKHISIGKDNTIIKDDSQDNRTLKSQEEDSTKDSKPVSSNSSYGKYLGYNIATKKSKIEAETEINRQARAGTINNSESTFTIPEYKGKEDQCIIVELYYNSQPKEEVDKLNVITRNIFYDSVSNEIVSTINGEEVTLGTNENRTFSKTGPDSDDYIGYSIELDNSDIPEGIDTISTDASCNIKQSDYPETNTVYINFKFKKEFSGTINIRHIFYYASGIKKSITSTARTINGSSGTEIINSNDGFSYNSSEYVYKGYIVLYDNALPSCYASIDSPSYTLDKSKYRSGGVYVNFMYQKKSTETELGKPTISDNGYLQLTAMSGALSYMAANSGINSNNEEISDGNILSMPLGETVEYKMKDLKKYYIAGLRIKEEEKASDKDEDDRTKSLTINIAHLTIIPVIDVNKNEITSNVGVYWNKYHFIVPYKYIKYSVENDDFATYILNQSKVYYPNGNNDNMTIGNKIFDTASSYSDIDYNYTSDVSYNVDTSGKDALHLVSFDANATFKSGVTTTTDTSTSVIDFFEDEQDASGNYKGTYKKYGGKKTISDLKVAQIYPLALGSATSGIIENKIADVFSNTGIGTAINALTSVTTAISDVSGVDGVILEIVPTYTNDTTQKSAFWAAVQSFFDCSVEFVGSLFGIEIKLEYSCADIGTGWNNLIAWFNSLIKDSVFIYKANLRSPTPDGDTIGYSIQAASGSLSPQNKTRAKLESVRNIEKTFTIATTSKTASLYYTIRWK